MRVVMDLKQNHRIIMWETGLQPILLNTTLENLSKLNETRTFISVWVLGYKQQILILTYFRKKEKGNGELIGSGVLEIRARRLCDHKHFQNCTSNASREDGPAPKLWTQMAPDTGHGCWHCWSAALRTWPHSNGVHCQKIFLWILASLHF